MGWFEERKMYLTDEAWEQIKDLPRGEIDKFVEDHVSDSVRYGYGYYGFVRFGYDEELKQHYAIFNTGTHCD